MRNQTPEGFTKVYSRNNPAACKKLVITVHGMGDQRRNETAASVAGLMSQTYVDGGTSRQAVRLPSGLWEGSVANDPVRDDVIAFVPMESGFEGLAEMGFAEIYWADVLREAEKDGHRIEGAPEWAGSVVDRLRQRHDLASEFDEGSLTLGASVVEEVAETVKLLNNLLFLTDKAGIFTFDLGRIMDQYLGDVQQVADFRYVRRKCLVRFLMRIRHLSRVCPDAELHFVAHSEGSVVMLYTLLQALRARENGSPRHGWAARVNSLTTFGSPIDKHLLLWPEMWGYLSEGEESFVNVILTSKQDVPKLEAIMQKRWFKPAKAIRWRNYYDFADPVGYDLDTARQKLRLWGCRAFEFEEAQDSGFRRYPLAGKAHVDYFGDVELFRHIRDSAVLGQTGITKPADTAWGRTSPYWPWLIIAALHFGAVFVLFRSLGAVTTDGEPTGAWLRSGSGMLASAMMLLGTTAWSRMNAILNRWCCHWGFVAWAVLMAGATSLSNMQSSGLAAVALLAPSSLLLLVGEIARALSQTSRKSPVWALRWQMMAGGTALAVAVLWLFRSPEASLTNAAAGAAGFLFLWWIASLLFDLVYVWQRYINCSRDATFLQILREKMRWFDAAKVLEKMDHEAAKMAKNSQ